MSAVEGVRAVAAGGPKVTFTEGGIVYSDHFVQNYTTEVFNVGLLSGVLVATRNRAVHIWNILPSDENGTALDQEGYRIINDLVLKYSQLASPSRVDRTPNFSVHFGYVPSDRVDVLEATCMVQDMHLTHYVPQPT